MKLATVKKQIDAYFDNVNPQELVQRFEALGYEFEAESDFFTFSEESFSDDDSWNLTEVPYQKYVYVNNTFLNYAIAA
jgi:hypothetical protein